jgi:hypothetical protein
MATAAVGQRVSLNGGIETRGRDRPVRLELHANAVRRRRRSAFLKGQVAGNLGKMARQSTNNKSR